MFPLDRNRICRLGDLSEQSLHPSRNGTSLHNATVNVHVAAVLPAAPAPSTILGLAPAIFCGVLAGIIAVVVAGTVLVLRPRGSLARCG
ncbi:hypothetical protein AUI46_01440 [archaeon 13_1_40CM_2_52_13]|nr:MAG: hypothetical protein AUI46_01440 [archaeon 13_1_40CM_2_52_13]OLE68456.1 MAG: hypothetical protein AUF78_16000 [archaeon 13_1_20CM_2_51_12]